MNGQSTIAVDIGNSAIKLAWENDEGLTLTSFPLQNSDWPRKLAEHVRQRFPADCSNEQSFQQIAIDGVRHWSVASVNRPATVRLQKLVSTEFPGDIWGELTRADVELPCDIRNPETVGIDRLLGAQAAVSLTGSPSVISIDAGSAVTVDLVRDGRFVGGAILPGIRLQFSVLCQATDSLPSVSGDSNGDTDNALPLEIPGKDTISAIRTGVLHGIAGAIDRLITLYSHSSTVPTPVIVTGGDAGILQALLLHSSRKIDGLVPMAILQLAVRKISQSP